MAKMRAKMQVVSVETPWEGAEALRFSPVCGKFGANGESEDNTFARWTPDGSVALTVTNPDLHGQFKPGQKFYLDFTEASE